MMRDPAPPILSAMKPAVRGRQRGVSLIFALITLVSLMIAAVALVRSLDTGSQILGNIGFQQDATATADKATREEITLLTQSISDLTTTNPAIGFYANAPVNLDATGQLGSPSTHTLVDWDATGNCGGASPAGCWTARQALVGDTTLSPETKAYAVIIRLCATDGAIGISNCAQPLTSSGGDPSNNGQCSAGGNRCASTGGTTGQYFRIVVRVTGARGTTSFTETIVQY